MSLYDVRTDNQGAGDRVLNDPASATGAEVAELATHPLDSSESIQLQKRLMAWYYNERTIQSDNRMEMQIDDDVYDGDQWDEADKVELESRGQMPLVFNEVAPMVDWLIGTERRSRVDAKVMPRTADDVEMADIKTKVMKYLSDANRVVFNRSRAFADAVKVGVGFVDDGVRNDPTKDILYSKFESWRNVLWDSMSVDLDMGDARYMFRTRYTDLDVAKAMFPDRADVLTRGVYNNRNWSSMIYEEDEFQREGHTSRGGSGIRGGVGGIHGYDADVRQRIKLIECQFRMPVTSKIVVDGPFRGSFLDPADRALMQALGEQGGTIIDRVCMRMHTAVMTEGALLSLGVSPMRHNDFSLTPIWCYRRGRDRMPYGAVRRVRDLQMDMNKRASKALFLMSTNQLIVEGGSVDDINETRQEADDPNGVLVYKAGKQAPQLRRDSEQAAGQLQMMSMNAQSIQRSAGISNENLGRQTNASSGEAIKARQLQGSVVTTEPFDNLRLATQVQGQKQLSLVEQWYTEEKVIRLTGSKGALDWLVVNKPEVQPDGTVRYLNDITRTQADYVVSEQDYAATMRTVLFDSMNAMASRMGDPMLALRLMTIAYEFCDLPNHDEIAQEIRKLTGERDPSKPLTPEEQQQMQQQMQAQAEAMQMQQAQAQAALQEQQAKVREINARADKLEAEAQSARSSGNPSAAGELDAAASMARRDAHDLLEKTQRQLAKTQAELANKTLQIKSDADTALQVARINADSRERVAQIAASSRAGFDQLNQRIDSFNQQRAGGAE